PGATPSTRTDAQKQARDQQLSAWRKQLNDAKTPIDSLRTRAANAPEGVKAELTGAVHDLDDHLDKIQGRINECKDADASSWNACRSDIDSMFMSLNQRIREVSDKFANAPAKPAMPGSPDPNSPGTTPPERNPVTPPDSPPPTPPTNPPGNPGPGP